MHRSGSFRFVTALSLAIGAIGAIGASGACAPPPAEAPRVYPPVDALPSVPALPPLFTSFFEEGRRVESADDWYAWRRQELLDLFAHYAYGAWSTPATTVERVAQAAAIDGAAIDYVELKVEFVDATGPRAVHVAVFSPAGAHDVPAVLGPNKCGNQSLVLDERVRATTAFGPPGCNGDSRGGRMEGEWPVARLVAAGFAVVTFHHGEMAADDRTRALEPAIAAWATGNSAALDALEQVQTPVDAARVAVCGHSRRGKGALLSGARDTRFAAVIAHQSGTLGASILRNGMGEPLILLTGVFPHWFTPKLNAFVGVEDRLPFDQHELLALVAPRPLLLLDGDQDQWGDPQGAHDAARTADAAWQLLGDDGLVEDAGIPRTDATLVWLTRPGEHDALTADWDLMLPFLERHLR